MDSVWKVDVQLPRFLVRCRTQNTWPFRAVVVKWNEEKCMIIYIYSKLLCFVIVQESVVLVTVKSCALTCHSEKRFDVGFGCQREEYFLLSVRKLWPVAPNSLLWEILWNIWWHRVINCDEQDVAQLQLCGENCIQWLNLFVVFLRKFAVTALRQILNAVLSSLYTSNKTFTGALWMVHCTCRQDFGCYGDKNVAVTVSLD